MSLFFCPTTPLRGNKPKAESQAGAKDGLGWRWVRDDAVSRHIVSMQLGPDPVPAAHPGRSHTFTKWKGPPLAVGGTPPGPACAVTPELPLHLVTRSGIRGTTGLVRHPTSTHPRFEVGNCDQLPLTSDAYTAADVPLATPSTSFPHATATDSDVLTRDVYI